MSIFLIVWGSGGCWSGYPHAAIVEAESLDAAKDLAGDRAVKCMQAASWGGASFDAAEIETTVEECPLFSRVICGFVQD